MQGKSVIEIVSGGKRAVFIRTEAGWRPDWFYHGQRAMLRFKDHQWLSIGHVHPEHAESGRKVGNSATFTGSSLYGTTRVDWTVRVKADRHGDGVAGAFVVETTFKPELAIELLEAYTTFELPYEYDGSEHFTTVIGQNPVVQFEGAKRTSPFVWRHPAWVYTKVQSARNTAPTYLPTLCHAIANADGSNARYTTVVGDWNVCKVRDIVATPTRDLDKSAPVPAQQHGRHGFKLFMGALNWSSAYSKDPNVLYAGGRKHRQRVIVDFDSSLPGGSMDAMLFAAWQRAAAIDIPVNGRVDAFDRATARGVSWGAAGQWLRDAFVGGQTPGFFTHQTGVCIYAPGTRPKFELCDWNWWPQWSGLLHYRAMLLDDAQLERTCVEYDNRYLDFVRTTGGQSQAFDLTLIPSMRWLRTAGKDTPLAQAILPLVQRRLQWLSDQSRAGRAAGLGGMMFVAENLLLAAEVYGHEAAHDAAIPLLREANSELDGQFWAFDMFDVANDWHGSQARPLCYGHAAAGNLLAFRATGEQAYLVAAQRFARLLVGLHYMTHNGSADAEFDLRGWANGTNAGRDQIAECPPWETSNSLLCVAGLMDQQELPAGCCDAIWYFARTGLAQFPAARTLKRVLDESMHEHFVPRSKIASEKDFYDTLPYMAYENPRDQTLLASYQGSDCLLGEMVYGGGLVECGDDRVTAIVAKAANLDASVATVREAHLWNPTAGEITMSATARWPDGSISATDVSVPPRSLVRVELRRQPALAAGADCVQACNCNR